MAISATTAIIVSAVVAAAATATSTYMSSQAQRKAADYNEAVAQNNAASARQQGAYEAERIREHNKRILSMQQAGYSKSGVDITTGTPNSVYTDSAVQGELDSLAALYTGRVRSTSESAQATLFGAQSDWARTSGRIGVGTSLLAGASQGASNYATMRT